MPNCIIVIPVYVENPSISEQASLIQLFNVLGKYTICIVTFKELNHTAYDLMAVKNRIEMKYEYFDKKFFSSVDDYNKLCLSREFYSRFDNFEYMLLYQLDAWVFKDELQYWCEKGYDYIGAPLFWCISANNFSPDFYGVGNGGFSLRKIDYCIRLLNYNCSKHYLKIGYYIWFYRNLIKYNERYKSLFRYILAFILCLVKCLGYHNNRRYILLKSNVTEDQFFGIYSNWINGFHANIAPIEESINFSFDAHPSLLFEKNGGMLPFGCHAFQKWEYNNFWSKFIYI